MMRLIIMMDYDFWFVFPIIGIKFGIESFCNKLVKLARENYHFGIENISVRNFVLITELSSNILEFKSMHLWMKMLLALALLTIACFSLTAQVLLKNIKF
jgi:hypothetical protein